MVRHIPLGIYTLPQETLKESNKAYSEILQKFWRLWLILGGDINLHLNPRLDKLDSLQEQHDSRNYRADISSFLDVNNITDVCRVINPDKMFFSWHQENKRSRLDYIFISEHSLNYVEDSGILPAIQSDHSRITLSLKPGIKPQRAGASGNSTQACCMIKTTSGI